MLEEGILLIVVGVLKMAYGYLMVLGMMPMAS